MKSNNITPRQELGYLACIAVLGSAVGCAPRSTGVDLEDKLSHERIEKTEKQTEYSLESFIRKGYLIPGVFDAAKKDEKAPHAIVFNYDTNDPNFKKQLEVIKLLAEKYKGQVVVYAEPVKKGEEPGLKLYRNNQKLFYTGRFTENHPGRHEGEGAILYGLRLFGGKEEAKPFPKSRGEGYCMTSTNPFEPLEKYGASNIARLIGWLVDENVIKGSDLRIDIYCKYDPDSWCNKVKSPEKK